MHPFIRRKQLLKLHVLPHIVLLSKCIVYGIRANGLFYRTWSVFDVAGKQLEDISVYMDSVYGV